MGDENTLMYALIIAIVIIFIFILSMNKMEGMFTNPIHYQNWDNFKIANPYDDRTNPDFQYRYGVVWPTIYV
jgi:hypothetical protein